MSGACDSDGMAAARCVMAAMLTPRWGFECIPTPRSNVRATRPNWRFLVSPPQ